MACFASSDNGLHAVFDAIPGPERAGAATTQAFASSLDEQSTSRQTWNG